MKFQDHHIGFHVKDWANFCRVTTAIRVSLGVKAEGHVVRYVGDDAIYSITVSGTIPAAKADMIIPVAEAAAVASDCYYWIINNGKPWTKNRAETLSVGAA